MAREREKEKPHTTQKKPRTAFNLFFYWEKKKEGGGQGRTGFIGRPLRGGKEKKKKGGEKRDHVRAPPDDGREEKEKKRREGNVEGPTVRAEKSRSRHRGKKGEGLFFVRTGGKQKRCAFRDQCSLIRKKNILPLG